jgi:hypothetical protein
VSIISATSYSLVRDSATTRSRSAAASTMPPRARSMIRVAMISRRLRKPEVRYRLLQKPWTSPRSRRDQRPFDRSNAADGHENLPCGKGNELAVLPSHCLKQSLRARFFTTDHVKQSAIYARLSSAVAFCSWDGTLDRSPNNQPAPDWRSFGTQRVPHHTPSVLLHVRFRGRADRLPNDVRSHIRKMLLHQRAAISR